MALPTTYRVGAITVSANGTVVTGTGTNWLAGGIREGDVFAAKGLTATIESVDSATSLTLSAPWAGPALTASEYEIRYTPDASRVLAAARAALEAMEVTYSGNAAALTQAQLRKNNLSASRAPLPSDNESQGYHAGSRWLSGGLEWLHAGLGRWVKTTEVTPEAFGAGRTGDDAPAFRASIEFLAAHGGGILRLGEAIYRLASLEERTTYVSASGGGGALTATTQCAPFFVPAGVSIIGPGHDKCMLDVSAPVGTLNGGVPLWDYSEGEISGFHLKGPGATTGSATGLHLSMLSAPVPHVNRNVRLARLRVTNWASYGIGQQYGAPENVTVEDILIEDTGADGIDWKVRFGPGDSQNSASGVTMDRITVRRPGQRVTTSISGLGIRGRCKLSNIEVTGLKAGCDGIQLSPGTGQGAEHRQPSARSTLTNFYVEGDDPGQRVVGLNCFSSGPLTVSNGYLRGCAVQTEGRTSSPTGFDDGPTILGVTVEGTRGYEQFRLAAPRSQLIGCRSLSDKEYFEEKRGNLAAGQTVFPVTGGITGPIIVQKNGATLTGGYTVSGNTVVLATPAIATDIITVIHPGYRPYRVEALHCSITGGGCDAYHTETGGMLSSSAVQDATLITGYYDERFPAVQFRQTSAADVRVISPNADEDLRLAAKGTGRVRANTGFRVGSATGVSATISLADGKTATITGGIITNVS